jgi:hypothetical protein
MRRNISGNGMTMFVAEHRETYKQTLELGSDDHPEHHKTVHLWEVTSKPVFGGETQILHCIAEDADGACRQCFSWRPISENARYFVVTAKQVPLRLRGWGQTEF